MDIQRSPDACWGRIGTSATSQLVLWSPVGRRLHVLNETAGTAWTYLERARSLDDLTTAMAVQFLVEREHVADDVAGLIAGLTEAGLVVDAQTARLMPPPLPSVATDAPNFVRPTSVGPNMIGPLNALGCELLVDVEDVELRGALAEILDPLRVPHAGVIGGEVTLIELHARSGDSGLGESGWKVSRNGREVATPTQRDHALRAVLAEVNGAAIDGQRSTVVLHAAGAEFGSVGERGLLVAFPGISNAGKSTLVSRLVQRGHAYLTDEAVAIDIDSLQALPFHKSVCVEQSAQNVLASLKPASEHAGLSRTWDVDPRTIGSGRLAEQGPIGAVVFPTYTPGATTQLTPLTQFDLLQKLIGNAFDFSGVGQPAFATLVRLANAVPGYVLEHGGDDSELDTLENVFGNGSPRVCVTAA